MEPRLRIMTLRLMEKLADDAALAEQIGVRGENGGAERESQGQTPQQPE